MGDVRNIYSVREIGHFLSLHRYFLKTKRFDNIYILIDSIWSLLLFIWPRTHRWRVVLNNAVQQGKISQESFFSRRFGQQDMIYSCRRLIKESTSLVNYFIGSGLALSSAAYARSQRTPPEQSILSFALDSAVVQGLLSSLFSFVF